MKDKKVFYFIFAAVTFNLAIRYPLVPHQIGSDSVYMHMLTNSILSTGDIQWFLDEFSLFGAFPFSYPSGMPCLLSSVALILDISVERSILVINFTFGFLSFLGTFIFSRMFFKTRESVLFSLLYSTSQGNLEFTTWSAVARSFYICFIPIFLLTIHSMFKYKDILKQKLIDIRYFILSVTLALTLISSHRISYSILICLIAFVITYFFIVVRDYYKVQISKLYANFIYLSILLVFFSYYFLPISGDGARTFLDSKEYSEGPLHWFTIVIVANVRSTGPLIAFAPIGLLIALYNRKSIVSHHLLFYLLLISPLSIDTTYSKYILLFINLYLGFIGLTWVKNNLIGVPIKKHFYAFLICLCLLFSLVFQFSNPNLSSSAFQLSNSSVTSIERHIDEDSYNFAIVLKYSHFTGLIGNEIDYSNRISAISEIPVFGTIGPTEITYGFKNSSQVILERNDIFSYQSWDEGLIKNTYKSDYDMYSDYAKIINRTHTNSEDKLSEKQITLAVENLRVYDFSEKKLFFESIAGPKYKIYEDSRSRATYIG